MYQKIKIGSVTLHLTQNILPEILNGRGLPIVEADYVHDIDNKQCPDLTIDIIENRLAAIYTGTPEQITNKIKNNNDKVTGNYQALDRLLNLETTKEIFPIYEQNQHLRSITDLLYRIKTWCWENQSKELYYDYILGVAIILAAHHRLEPNKEITNAINNLLHEEIYDNDADNQQFRQDLTEFATRNQIPIIEK